MGRPRVQHYCRDCGVPVPNRGRWDGGYSCVDCAVARSGETARQINERQGEYYERWIAGMAKAVEKLQAQVAGTVAGQDPAQPK